MLGSRHGVIIFAQEPVRRSPEPALWDAPPVAIYYPVVAQVSGINHITLAVPGVDDAIRFYTDILGCELVARWPKGAYLLAGETWIALVEGTPSTSSDDYSHIAFSVDDFDEMTSRVCDAGAALWQENWTEGESLYFLDPAGHRLELHKTTLADRVRATLQCPWEGLEILQPEVGGA